MEEGSANARESEPDVFEALAGFDLWLECIELGREGRQGPGHEGPCGPGREFVFYLIAVEDFKQINCVIRLVLFICAVQYGSP